MLAIVDRDTDEIISYISKECKKGFRDIVKTIGHIDDEGTVMINGVEYNMDQLVLTNYY